MASFFIPPKNSFLLFLFFSISYFATLQAQFIDTQQSLGTSYSSGVALGDIDHDGDLDAIVSNYNAVPSIFLNDGYGIFSPSNDTIGNSANSGVAAGDFNLDGHIDFFFTQGYSGYNNNHQAWLNDGTGSFIPGLALQAGRSSYVELIDFNGDTLLDIAMTFDYAVQRAGSLSNAASLVAYTSTNGALFGDLNGDDRPDVVVLTSNGNPIRLNRGDGAILVSTQSLGTSNSKYGQAADVDGDMDLDLVILNSGSIAHKVWINQGSMNFSQTSQTFGSSSDRRVLMGDVDRDGDQDAYITKDNGTNVLYLNNGSGNFAWTLSIGIGIDAALGDLNGDGALDIFTVRNGGNRVYLNAFPRNCDLETCVGKPLTFTPDSAAAGNIYAWDFGDGTTSTLQNPTHSYTSDSSFTVTLNITDLNGCITTSERRVCVYTPPSATYVAQDPSCNGASDGSIDITVSGGIAANSMTYLWAPNGETTQDLTNLSAGTYTLVITDSITTCTDSIVVTLTDPPLLTASATLTNPISCFGLNDGEATLSSTGGTPPLTYAWSPSGGNGNVASNLGPGTYFGTVTDSLGCTATDSVTLTEPLLLTVAPTNSGNVCQGDSSANLFSNPAGGTQPLNFNWNAGTYVTQDVSGVGAGTYTLTVTDQNGCTATGSTIIGSFSVTPATFQISQ